MHSMQMKNIVWWSFVKQWVILTNSLNSSAVLWQEASLWFFLNLRYSTINYDCKVESMRNHNNPEVTELVTERHILCKSLQCSADSITAQLQISSGIKINRKTLCPEPNDVGLHGHAAPVNLAGDQSFRLYRLYIHTITAEWAYHIPSYKPRNNDHSTSTKIKIHLSSFHCDY